MASIEDSLEGKASKIIKRGDNQDWGNSIPEMLKRDIALTVSQINRLRKFHKKQHSRILDTKCDIGTEITQLEDRTPRYSSKKYPEGEKLHRRLLETRNEERRQDILYEERLQRLQQHLLGLIHKHEQIK